MCRIQGFMTHPLRSREAGRTPASASRTRKTYVKVQLGSFGVLSRWVHTRQLGGVKCPTPYPTPRPDAACRCPKPTGLSSNFAQLGSLNIAIVASGRTSLAHSKARATPRRREGGLASCTRRPRSPSRDLPGALAQPWRRGVDPREERSCLGGCVATSRVV